MLTHLLSQHPRGVRTSTLVHRWGTRASGALGNLPKVRGKSYCRSLNLNPGPESGPAQGREGAGSGLASTEGRRPTARGAGAAPGRLWAGSAWLAVQICRGPRGLGSDSHKETGSLTLLRKGPCTPSSQASFARSPAVPRVHTRGRPDPTDGAAAAPGTCVSDSHRVSVSTCSGSETSPRAGSSLGLRSSRSREGRASGRVRAETSPRKGRGVPSQRTRTRTRTRTSLRWPRPS